MGKFFLGTFSTAWRSFVITKQTNMIIIVYVDTQGRIQQQNKPDFNCIGIIGSGTMGSGIALAALLADLKVVLYDIESSYLNQAVEYVERHLSKRQRLISIKYLQVTTRLDTLNRCGYVIEAAPEELTIKQDLFSELSNICPPPSILATNTSTLSVTAIGSAVQDPVRFAGMHFFNPAPVMPLIEIVRGALTSQETVEALIRLGNKLGKQTVLAKDTPGFIVNRVARPFYSEALRIMSEGAASHEQIDRIARMGAGFRMGPFELMDLIGIDINFAATKSIFEQTFYEPRYRPSQIQAQMVNQLAFGRKSGRGFYQYDGDSESGRRANEQPNLPYRNQPEGDAARVIVCPGTWAPGLMNLLASSSYKAAAVEDGIHQAPVGIVPASRSEGMKELIAELDLVLPPKSLLLAQCADTTLSEIAGWIYHPERLVGFDGLFMENSQLVTLTSLELTTKEAHHDADAFFNNLGLETAWIEDIPGLVLPRIICCLVNEGAFAAGEGTAPPETIDLAMRLGGNYPQGPLEWGRKIGRQRVAAVLDHLFNEYGEERYRTAPLLKKLARLEFVKKKPD